MTGKQLRDLRKSHDLTQVELAELLHSSQAAVSDWERGRRPISRSVEKLIRLSLGELTPRS